MNSPSITSVEQAVVPSLDVASAKIMMEKENIRFEEAIALREYYRRNDVKNTYS